MIIIFLLLLLTVPITNPPYLHAKEHHESLAPQGNFIPGDEAFRPILAAYNSFNFEKAIHETRRLKWNNKNPEIAEKAAYLLGNLYLVMAERARPTLFRKALDAFRDARLRYPHSKQAIPALMKMGEIYTRSTLYYEALASFNRIIRKYPKSLYVIPARLKKGEVYLKWGKFDQSIKAFDQINPALLSRRERVILLLSYAKSYYQQDKMETAFQYYKLISPQNVILQSSPPNLYQYGIAAYRSKAYRLSREVLFILHNKYPKTPRSLLALARIGDTLRLDGKTDLAKKIYKQVENAGKNKRHYKSAILIARIGQLYLTECSSQASSPKKSGLPKKAPSPKKSVTSKKLKCLGEQFLKNKTGHLAFQEIKESSDLLLQVKDRSVLTESVLFEAVEALEAHQFFATALKIKTDIIKQKISAPILKKVNRSLGKTAVSAVKQLLKKEANAEAFEIFYQHRKSFTQKILSGTTGLLLGKGFSQSGLYPQAVELLEPIAHNKKKDKTLNRREALFFLTKTNFKQKEDKLAEARMKTYRTLYPKNRRIQSLEILSAEMSVRQWETALAIKKYMTWLKRYPKQHERTTVLMRLGQIYKKNGNYKRAISTYLKIPQKKRGEIPGLHLKIADAFYSLKNYKRAVPFYLKALGEGGEAEAVYWAIFQLAQSYEKLGLTDKGDPLYARLGQNESGKLIKAFSKQKMLEGKTRNEASK